MLKTRPRVLLGVIFFSVNIDVRSDMSRQSHPSSQRSLTLRLQLDITITEHYLPLVNWQGRNLFTGAWSHISVAWPGTCLHQSPSYLPCHPTTSRVGKIFFIWVIDKFVLRILSWWLPWTTPIFILIYWIFFSLFP